MLPMTAVLADPSKTRTIYHPGVWSVTPEGARCETRETDEDDSARCGSEPLGEPCLYVEAINARRRELFTMRLLTGPISRI